MVIIAVAPAVVVVVAVVVAVVVVDVDHVAVIGCWAHSITRYTCSVSSDQEAVTYSPQLFQKQQWQTWRENHP